MSDENTTTNIVVTANVENTAYYQNRDDTNLVYFIASSETDATSDRWENKTATNAVFFLGKTVYPLGTDKYVFTTAGSEYHPIGVNETNTEGTYYIPVASDRWLEVKRLTKVSSDSVSDNS